MQVSFKALLKEEALKSVMMMLQRVGEDHSSLLGHSLNKFRDPFVILSSSRVDHKLNKSILWNLS